MRDGARLALTLPSAVAGVLARLAADGAQAVLVGGCVRDIVHGGAPTDWDVATDAAPERVAALFPGASWTNPFGTVTVHPDDGPPVEVTTYRIETSYRDRRRPDAVRWGSSLDEDLARRDFTINAMAWRPSELERGVGELLDPYDGSADLAAGVLRAVGDPAARFSEDALRLVRAVRFATRFGLTIEPATEAAIRANAASAAGLSGERLRDEILRILADEQPPSRAFLLMERLGLLGVVLPELAALRGVPQAKRLAGDALDHSLRAADALPVTDPVLRLAGLLHDLGKATTLADGHFIGHEKVGAALAETALRRLRLPKADITRVTRLIRHHMFAYTPAWSDAAVRRFVRRVGPDLVDDLLALRRADNAASGVRETATGGSDELGRRAHAAIRDDPLRAGQLAVTGDDIIRELDLEPGPRVGRILAFLLESVLDDPSLNQPGRLIEAARDHLAELPPGDAVHHRRRRRGTAGG
jgi:tRNA nucleotidyltransferase (CCA-adding enzyme)